MLSGLRKFKERKWARDRGGVLIKRIFWVGSCTRTGGHSGLHRFWTLSTIVCNLFLSLLPRIVSQSARDSWSRNQAVRLSAAAAQYRWFTGRREHLLALLTAHQGEYWVECNNSQTMAVSAPHYSSATSCFFLRSCEYTQIQNYIIFNQSINQFICTVTRM